MTARAEQPLTAEQLEAGRQRLARHVGVPDSLDAALADPLYSPLVRGMARMLLRMRRHQQPQFTAALRRPYQRRPGLEPFDARRAAANDLKDD